MGEGTIHSSPFATTSNPPAKRLQFVAKVLPCKRSAWLGNPPLQGTRRFNYFLILHPARKTLPHCTGPKGKEAPEKGGAFKGMTITELTQWGSLSGVNSGADPGRKPVGFAWAHCLRSYTTGQIILHRQLRTISQDCRELRRNRLGGESEIGWQKTPSREPNKKLTARTRAQRTQGHAQQPWRWPDITQHSSVNWERQSLVCLTLSSIFS